MKQEKKGETNKKKKKKFDLKTLLLFILEFIILWMVFHYFVFIAYVPSASMVPTIPKGSVTLVTYLHGEKEVERGECVVFWSKEFGERLVKRVVGLPGEKVRIDEKGNVYINNEKLNEEYVENQYGIEQRVFIVPEGCYFFLGDNRGNSEDARFWENPYISSEELIGKVQILIWPFNAISYLG